MSKPTHNTTAYVLIYAVTLALALVVIFTFELGMSSVWAFLLGVVMPLGVTFLVYDQVDRRRR